MVPTNGCAADRTGLFGEADEPFVGDAEKVAVGRADAVPARQGPAVPLNVVEADRTVNPIRSAGAVPSNGGSHSIVDGLGTLGGVGACNIGNTWCNTFNIRRFPHLVSQSVNE